VGEADQAGKCAGKVILHRAGKTKTVGILLKLIEDPAVELLPIAQHPVGKADPDDRVLPAPIPVAPVAMEVGGQKTSHAICAISQT